MTQQQFIDQIANYVIKYASNYGICVHSPIIAQAILESKSGTSELAVNANNFFGLKYKSNVADGIYYKVGSEQNPDGSYVSSQMQWCKFNTFERGVEGYFKFTSATRYNNLKGITDPRKYLETIKADGYATSLKYVDNLMAVINKYDLTKYDNKSKDNNDSINVDTKKYYRVQVGAYKDYNNALTKQKEIKSKGFNCIIKQYDNLYKCQIGAYNNKINADLLLQDLKKVGINAFIAYC